MNTAGAVNPSNTIPPVVSSVQDIPLNRIQESKTNPRRTFDEAKLAELASNIRQHGVLQPILVRPLPAGADGFFDLVPPPPPPPPSPNTRPRTITATPTRP